MNIILAFFVGVVVGGVGVYFVFRNPKNDQFKAKVDKAVDKVEDIID